MSVGFGKSDNWEWSKDLTKAAYAKAAKGGKIDYVLDSLRDAEKFKEGLNIPFAPGTGAKPVWQKWETDVQAFIAGPAKKLTGNLMVIKKRASNALADKDVAKDKDCKAALAAIAKACDVAMKEVDSGTLKSKAAAAMKEGEKIQQEFAAKYFGPVAGTWKSCTGKGHPDVAEAKKLLAAAAKAPDQAAALNTMGGRLRTGARNMTQNIGNMLKFKEKGLIAPGLAESDYGAMNKMMAILGPIANAQGDWTKGDMAAAQMGWKNVNALTQMFDQIGKKIKV